jgi:SAM-dependent methyltransferase
VDLDDPKVTAARLEIIKGNGFLNRIYRDWYDRQRRALEGVAGPVVELGSGAGFIKEVLPGVITSDIMPLDWVDRTFSAESMPFPDGGLGGIVMLNVLHHIPQVRRFLREAERTLAPGGRVVMIEPANTLFARLIYRNLHHEPFEPGSGWEFASSGPLSGANGALPWILFCRDRPQFEQEFPRLRLKCREPHTPLLYLVSGGVSRRSFLPVGTFGLVQALERWLPARHFGMFMTVVLEKTL